MPKGYQKYTADETAVMKANRAIQKGFRRLLNLKPRGELAQVRKEMRAWVKQLDKLAAELEQRPDPVITKMPPKSTTKRPTARQLKLPGVTKRKAAKRAKRSS
jgi:hypothetical protein